MIDPYVSLPGALDAAIRRANPWWRGEKPESVPPFRRFALAKVLHSLRKGLAPITLLRGPRGAGKATIVCQVVEQLLRDGVPPTHIFRVQFDDIPEIRTLESPILHLSRWFSDFVLQSGYHDAVRAGGPTYILLDEVRNLPDWAPQVKHLVDLNPVRLLVTGSSALRIEAGRDSLAGRILTMDIGPLRLGEIAALRGLGPLPPMFDHNGVGALKQKETWIELRGHGQANAALRDHSFQLLSSRGGYPMAHAAPDQPWEQVADFLNETVIQRAIRHDLRVGVRGQRRDEHLLEEVFRLACRYAGQAPRQALYLDEVQCALNANIGWLRILAYLKFLDSSLLIRLIEPLELRLKRRRGASKVCLSDHSLRAFWLQEQVPLAPQDLAALPHLSDLAGHIAESTVGYYLSSLRGLAVAHFP